MGRREAQHRHVRLAELDRNVLGRDDDDGGLIFGHTFPLGTPSGSGVIRRSGRSRVGGLRKYYVADARLVKAGEVNSCYDAAMRYRPLHGTNLRVSELGFGTWTVSTGWWGDYSDEQARDLIRAGLDLGINYIDTAD